MKLHFGNLPKTMTDSELKDLVTPFGQPASLEIIKDNTGSSKGFGFAEFDNADQARAVITGLDGKDVGGQALKVSEARPRKGDKPAAASAPQA
jgi:RNA recognition motif-containing protein